MPLTGGWGRQLALLRETDIATKTLVGASPHSDTPASEPALINALENVTASRANVEREFLVRD